MRPYMAYDQRSCDPSGARMHDTPHRAATTAATMRGDTVEPRDQPIASATTVPVMVSPAATTPCGLAVTSTTDGAAASQTADAPSAGPRGPRVWERRIAPDDPATAFYCVSRAGQRPA